MSETTKRPRIFVGLQEIAGYYRNLHQSFLQLGCQSHFVEIVGWSCDSAIGLMPKLHDALHHAQQQRDTLPAKSLQRRGWKWAAASLNAAYNIGKFLILLWAALSCDVFIFACGRTFFNYREVPWLKRLGKKVIVTFNGSDHRPPYLNGSVTSRLDLTNPKHLDKLHRQTLATKDQVTLAETHADCVVGLSSSAQFHTKPFADFLVMGLPFVLSTYGIEPKDRTNASDLTIVHAPSNPVIKGTALIRDLVARLQAERGPNDKPIRYVEIINQPHHKVIEALADCDLVIDELYSDTIMAGLATEAAVLGKPAVVCGYALDFLTANTPAHAIAPVSHSLPQQFEANVRRIVNDAEYRLALGQAAKTFVNNYWSPLAVAKRYLQLMSNTPPSELFFNPSNITYVHGVAFTEESLKAVIKDYLPVYGEGGLCLKDKPALIEQLKALSGAHTPQPATV